MVILNCSDFELPVQIRHSYCCVCIRLLNFFETTKLLYPKIRLSKIEVTILTFELCSNPLYPTAGSIFAHPVSLFFCHSSTVLFEILFWYDICITLVIRKTLNCNLAIKISQVQYILSLRKSSYRNDKSKLLGLCLEGYSPVFECSCLSHGSWTA